MPNFPTSQIGQTSLRVPIIGLGTAPLGNFLSRVSETEAIETIRYAIEQGASLIDTAPFYDAGLVEQRVGLALKDGLRGACVLATKVGMHWAGNRVIHDLTQEEVLHSLDESLARLQVDFVDILHIHDPHEEHYRLVFDETFPTLADLRSQGVIKAVGAGLNRWETVIDFVHHADFDCFMLAGRYTLLEQGALNALNLCEARRIGILAGGVYNSGILATGVREDALYQYRPAPPDIRARVRRIESVCARHEVPLNAAAVQFVKAHPAVTSVVLGVESVAQMADNIHALQTPVPPGLWDDLRAENLIDPAAPTPKNPPPCCKQKGGL